MTHRELNPILAFTDFFSAFPFHVVKCLIQRDTHQCALVCKSISRDELLANQQRLHGEVLFLKMNFMKHFSDFNDVSAHSFSHSDMEWSTLGTLMTGISF